jgi:prevent-host-death family protein
MVTVTATQAARSFASILDAVEHGETVVITRDGVPVGRLVPRTPHISGPAQGRPA